MKITIVGNGVFGNAMLYVLQKNSNSVRIVDRGDSIDGDIVVLCVPAQSIKDVLPIIHFSNNIKIIVNTAKGIERTSHKFPYQLVKEKFENTVEYYTLMGPSFAQEIEKEMPTLVNIGHYADASHKKTIKELFHTDFFHVRLTEGVEALEIASAMKNIYAIGCGISEGLGFGENTKAKLLTLAIEEMQKLYKGLNLKVDTESTAGTTGDLILTCASRESRNFRFGKYLVTYPAEEALKKVNSTVEGYNSIHSLTLLQKQAQVTLPLASTIAKLVKGDQHNLQRAFVEFMRKA